MPYSATVAATSIKIAPLADIRDRSIQEWVTGTAYAQGAYVKSNGRVYMAQAAGTSGATAPDGHGVVSDGTVSWVSALQNCRKGITFVNEGSTTVYLGQSPLTAGEGIALSASGGAFTLTGDATQNCEWHAIRASGSGNVAILEW
jgi:hypothetical protein